MPTYFLIPEIFIFHLDSGVISRQPEKLYSMYLAVQSTGNKYTWFLFTLKCLILSFQFWIVFSLHIEYWVNQFCFSAVYKCYTMSSGLRCFFWSQQLFLSLLCNVPFLFAYFQDCVTIISFPEFDFYVTVCNFFLHLSFLGFGEILRSINWSLSPNLEIFRPLIIQVLLLSHSFFSLFGIPLHMW